MARTVTVTFDDNTSHTYEGIPEGITPEQVTERAQKEFGKGVTHLDGGKKLKVPEPKKSPLAQRREKKESGFLDKAIGTADALMTVGSSIVAEPLAGAAGLVDTAYTGIKEGDLQAGLKAGADTVESAREGMTYLPKTDTGKEYVQNIGETLKPVGDALNATEEFLGGNATDIAKNLGSDDETAAAFGAVAHSLPTAALEVLGLKLARSGSKADDVARAAKRSSKGAKAAGRSNMAAIQNDIVLELKNQGIDYKSLSKQAQSQISDFVERSIDSGADIDPVVIARQAKLDQLPKPVKGTKGQLGRDYMQERLEKEIAETAGGEKLRLKFQEQPVQMVENLDEVARQTGGRISADTEFGSALRDIVSKQAQSSKGRVRAAYKAAEDAVGDNVARVGDDVVQWLEKNKGFEGVSGLENLAANLGIVKRGKDGVLVATDAPLRNLKELRSAASKLQGAGSSKGYNAGALKGMIDDTVDAFGGEAYRDAAKLRRKHAIEFDTKGTSVQKLLKKAGKGDAEISIADEKVFDRIIRGGSVKEVKDLNRFLLEKGGKRGAEQVKNIRAQTTQYLKDAATNAGNTKSVEFRIGAFENAVKKMGGREKLAAIYGEKGAKQIQDIIDAGNILFKQSPDMTAGSQTAGRISRMIEKGFEALEKIPVVGGEVKRVRSSAGAADALQDSVKVAEKAISKAEAKKLAKIKRRQGRNALAGLAPAAASGEKNALANKVK